MKLLVLVVALLLSTAVRADWSLEFVRITCIPEARYFYFEYKPIDGSAALTDAQVSDEKQRERMRTWQKHGYFDPRDLDFECRLPESRYRLRTSQPPGHEGRCGAAPTITLNLLRNGSSYVKDVTLGDDCYGGPSVLSVEIADKLDGWGTREMTICVKAGQAEAAKCTFLSETYGDITKVVPITPAVVERYAKER
jgi:hypothetical protein